MKYSTTIVSLIAMAAPSVFAGNYSNVTEVYSTVTDFEVVTEFTTYCPVPTTLTYGTNTITVTGATTLTITDCPCTIPKTTPTPEVEVVTEFTTYCPEPTTLTYGTNTITVTAATTLTITDCPCTVSKATPTPEITAAVLTPEEATTSTVCPPEGCDSTITVPIKVTVTNSHTLSGNSTSPIPIVEATGAADKLIPAGAFAGAIALVFLF